MPRDAVDRRRFLALALAAGAAGMAGCTRAPSGPEPLLVGADTCAFCRMTILDGRVAAEYLLSRRLIKFDEAGCLRDWVLANDPARRGAAWLADYAGGGWTPASEATLVAGAVATPMGTNLVAFRRPEAAARLVERRGGARLAGAELLGAGARAGRRYALARSRSGGAHPRGGTSR